MCRKKYTKVYNHNVNKGTTMVADASNVTEHNVNTVMNEVNK